MIPIIFFTLTTFESLAIFIYTVTFKSADEAFLSLSVERIFLSAGLLVIFLLSASLLVWSCLSYKKGHSIIKKLVENESVLWISFVFCMAVMVLSYLLIIKGIDLNNQFDAVSTRLNPILTYLITIAAQSALIIAATYLSFFTLNEKNRDFDVVEKETASLFGVFLFVVLIKLIFVIAHAYGPVGAMDEMSYFYYSESFYLGNTYDAFDFRYPPLYPISIIPAFSFNGFAYDGILLINSLLTSAIVFPIYYISRQVFNHRKSLLIAFIPTLISFNLVFPARIASENLYFPLFFWALLAGMVNPKNQRFRIFWDISLGVLLAALYLTRFITLAAIPFFVAAWWLKPFDGEANPFKLNSKKILHLSALAASAVIVFLPWLLLGLNNDIPFKHLLGFIIASKTTPEQLTILNLFKYVIIYGAYLILMASPVLNLIFGLKPKLFFKRVNSIPTRWALSVLLVISGFFIAIVRHSWRALYNANLPTKLMGRYLIYFAPVFILLAFAQLEEFKREEYKSFAAYFLRHQILPMIIICLSYLTIFTHLFFKTGENIIKPFGSSDAFLVEIYGAPYLAVIFLIHFLVNLVLWKKGKNYAIFAACITMIGFYLAGTPAYLSVLNEERTYPYLSFEISKLMPPPKRGEFVERAANIILASDFPGEIQREIHNGLRVRGIISNIYTSRSYTQRSDQLNGKEFIIKYPEQELDIEYQASRRFEYRSEEFEVLELN